MKDSLLEAAFNEAYRARLRALRDERGWTAEEMAGALGIPADRYRKYESRSPLPPYLIERVALVFDTGVEYIVTGRGRRTRPAVIIPLPPKSA